MLTKFFIERPVLANVIALVTMLLGGVAMLNLPVAQYPPITPPTIQVTATYPGANAKTLVETVALPIQPELNDEQARYVVERIAAFMDATSSTASSGHSAAGLAAGIRSVINRGRRSWNASVPPAATATARVIPISFRPVC